MRLKPFLQGFGIIAVILSLFPFVAADYWWIRMFDFPHLQLTFLTLLAILIYFFRFDIRNWRDYSFIGLLVVCFLFQLGKIFPYTQFASHELKDNLQSDPKRVVSILAINVLQKNDKYEKVIDEILTWNPDILVFTETNQTWAEELRWGLREFGYDHRLEMPLENTYGMLLYSKLKLIDPRVEFLIEDSIPSMRAKVVLPSQELAELHIIHPTPPMPQHNPKSTDRDAQMMMVAKMAQESKYPVIVAGDFNDVAWSETTQLFQNVSQLLDARKGRGLYNTFGADAWIMRWPLDHLFVSKEFRLMDIARGRNVGSDHFPYYAKLSFEPEGAEDQDIPEPTAEEKKEAQNQVQKEKKKDQKEKEKAEKEKAKDNTEAGS